MATNEKEGIFALKKVGKFWLVGKSGGSFKKCPQLTHAQEVDINDNFLVADEIVYEIKEGEHGHYLVKVEEMLVYDEDSPMSKKSERPIRPLRDDETKYDHYNKSFLSYQGETHLPANFNEMKITDKTEQRRKDDFYYIFEAGQTEDISFSDSFAGSKKGLYRWRNYLGPSIVIIKDSLENVKVDAIACTTSHDFKLSRSSASNALLKRGGEILQRALDEGSRGIIEFGEVIPVLGHGLDCKVILFGAMYPYDPKFSKQYKCQDEYYRIVSSM